VGEHHVHYNSGRPDIALLVIAFEEDLWCDVVGCANALCELFIALFLLGDAEVDDLDDATVSLEEHVFWFQIAVNNSHMCQIEQYLEDLLDDTSNVGLGQLLTSDNLLEELAAFTKFEDEHVVRLVVIDLVEADYVYVVQRLHDCHFHKQLLVLLLAQR
jgi:hypothetical protein